MYVLHLCKFCVRSLVRTYHSLLLQQLLLMLLLLLVLFVGDSVIHMPLQDYFRCLQQATINPYRFLARLAVYLVDVVPNLPHTLTHTHTHTHTDRSDVCLFLRVFLGHMCVRSFKHHLSISWLCNPSTSTS